MNTATVTPTVATDLVQSRFVVPGIHCAGCIGKIERGFADVPGVHAARVNFTTKRVVVQHTSDTSEDSILSVLDRLGFEAQPVETAPTNAGDMETRRLLRALAVAGFGMMNVMLLSVAVWSGATGPTRDIFHWLSALIAVPVVAYSGRPFFASAVAALRRRHTNMDVPISIGVLVTTLLSVHETAIGGPHAYFDGVVMLLFFLLAGRVLDAMMRDRARSGIGALLARMGREATIVAEDGATRRVLAADIVPGMMMSVAAGEALAADGEIVEGRTSFDSSMITGESAPRPAKSGDPAYAGMVNLDARVSILVTAAAEDTAIAEIARLMAEAGQSRSRYVRVADRAARLYAPVVHTLALASLCGWLLVGVGLHQALLIAVAVLIITCPCALGLAVPAAHVVVAGALMRRGLLIKDGSALERLAEADFAVFDKTGTLTMGEMRPVALSGLAQSEKSVALALAQASRHPISRGLTSALRDEGVTPARVRDIVEDAGNGLRGMHGEVPVALVRPPIQPGELPAVNLVIGDEQMVIELIDPLRPDVAETLAALSAMNLDAMILSGDAQAPVASISRQFGIPFRAQLDPAEKLAVLDDLARDGKHVLMVGDGLNDGPALAAAHVSLAPAGASDVSRQAADAVFLGDKLMPTALAVRAARQTMRTVRQNFTLAVCYNIIAVPLAVAGMVTPLIAALAMSLSSLVVVANSLRLARVGK